tara:strand:- start:131 stop:253 length:123 start_codon:yes stop_codon:yes gene_type:complete
MVASLAAYEPSDVMDSLKAVTALVEQLSLQLYVDIVLQLH